MKRDDAKKLSDEALEELAAQLAAGKSEELTKFLKTMSRFHNYSFGNCMLIARQMPTATRVAGFRAWQKLNRQVRKGEKGICILAPLVGKKKAEDGSSESEVFGFRAVHVFDVSQTDGKELPDIHKIEGDPGEKLSRLHTTAIGLGITLSYEEDLGGADGISQGGSIVLLSGLTAAAEFNTLAHELAHELLHRGEDRKTLSKTVKELEAESVAYVVSTAAGLTGALEQSADYIHCHAGDSEQLARSLQRIQKTASLLLEQLEAVPLEPLSEVA
ncbi:ArdC family protein [Bythopirellula goksoeyrii]|uniref:N-terminal domain-containing protein n=1 Tax=Bythopirellula goksoeyrii TaxID=1400387 RepID=A0A5B9QEC7_9BACT|nr:ArdC family protein [Bythopirellula goksoeyrii]QEG36229.1 hypothetical protein Pr1d_35410 [Bythopirellula goksoeyrii]